MLKKIILFLRGYDWIMAASVFVLIVVGLSAIYSVDLSRGAESLNFLPTQLVALGLGIILLIVAARSHTTVYKKYTPYIYIASLILLLGVLFFGVTISGTTGWYRIGSLSFQPAEIAKVGLILILGWLVDRTGRRFYEFSFFFSSGFLAFLAVALILLQPDLGSAFILFGIWASFLFFTNVKKRYIFTLVISVVGVFLLGWFFLFEDYQKARLTTFINPSSDPLGAGYNLQQSLIAIGSGRWFGRGLGFGSQSQLKFLPEAQTDFIFSVIAEELGFVGVLLIIIPFFVLLWRLAETADRSKSEFGAYVAFGAAIFFFLQFMLNVGSSAGLLPITGVPLPFVSYGGSSLIINLLLVGVVESIAKYSTGKEKALDF